MSMDTLTVVKFMSRIKGQDTLKSETTVYVGGVGRETAKKHFYDLAASIRRDKWEPGYQAVRMYEPKISRYGAVLGDPELGKLNTFYDSQTRDTPKEVEK